MNRVKSLVLLRTSTALFISYHEEKNRICNECDVILTKNKQNEFERRLLLLLLADFVRLRNIYSFITYRTSAGGNSSWKYLYNFESFIHFRFKDFTPTLPTSIFDICFQKQNFRFRTSTNRWLAKICQINT